jgi:hypothetical protein
VALEQIEKPIRRAHREVNIWAFFCREPRRIIEIERSTKTIQNMSRGNVFACQRAMINVNSIVGLIVVEFQMGKFASNEMTNLLEPIAKRHKLCKFDVNYVDQMRFTIHKQHQLHLLSLAHSWAENYGLHNRPRLDMMIIFIFSPPFVLWQSLFFVMNYERRMVIYLNYFLSTEFRASGWVNSTQFHAGLALKRCWVMTKKKFGFVWKQQFV